MTRNLSSDLIQRIRSRVADPNSRTDAWDTSPSTSFLGGAFKTIRVQIGGDTAPPAGPEPLPPPATAEDITSAQEVLGFPLPDDLVQLYRQVANGGFGPAEGLASIEVVAERHRDLIENPPDDWGARWPEHMLPIGLAAPGADCYDLRSGQILFWDEEWAAELPDEQPSGYSFALEAESLQAWLEAWLSRLPLAEQQKRDMENALLDGMRQTLAHWRAMSAEERAEFGLPEEGWEEELFGHLGIDLTDL